MDSNKLAGIQECVNALAQKRGITKSEADGILHDVLEIIEDNICNGGVIFKGLFTIKPKIIKARSGKINGKEWSSADKKSISIHIGHSLEVRLNSTKE